MFIVSVLWLGLDFGILIYFIVGGNLDNVFKIDISSGKVILVKNFDYEIIKKYNLIIWVIFDFFDGNILDVVVEVIG